MISSDEIDRRRSLVVEGPRLARSNWPTVWILPYRLSPDLDESVYFRRSVPT